MHLQAFTSGRDISVDYVRETGSITIRLDGDAISLLSVDRDGYQRLVDSLRVMLREADRNPPPDDAFDGF